MNKVILIGNLTQDPELSEVGNGTKTCRFTLAVNRDYKNANGERDTDFINCQAWRGTAENLVKYMSKGRKIVVTGSIQVRSYESGGERRTATDVQVQDIEFLSSPTKGGGNTASNDGYDDDDDSPF